MSVSHALEEFFRSEVNRAFQERGLGSGTLTRQYVVRLLAAYAAQPIEDEPLALKMLRAVRATPRERRAQLREIGDTSLFVSGFWADSLENKLVDVDYYIDMGGTAYGELARSSAPRPWADEPLDDVFAELAARFTYFVEALMLIARRTTHAGSNTDILRLYRRWQRTRSRWVGARLASLGVLPQSGDGRPQ